MKRLLSLLLVLFIMVPCLATQIDVKVEDRIQRGGKRAPSAVQVSAFYENGVVTVDVSRYYGEAQVFVYDSDGYSGEKQYLIPDYSSTFIVYNSASNVTAGSDIVSRGDYSDAKKAVATRASQIHGKNWAIVNGCKQRTRANNADIYYLSPVYKSPKTGERIKLSNLIHLKLKAQEDTTMLYEQMRKYGL